MTKTHVRVTLLLMICLNAFAVTAFSQPGNRKPNRDPNPHPAKRKSASEPGRLYPVSQRNSRYRNSFGFIDSTGNLVIDFERLPKTTKYVSEFHEGLAVIYLEHETYEDTIMGYIDRTGKIVIGPRFDYARDFSEGLAYVETKTFHGFIDHQGKTVISLEDLTSAFGTGIDGLGAKNFHEGRAAVGTGRWSGYEFSFGDDANMWDGRWGYIDRAGKLVVKPVYFYADDFSEGRAGVVAIERGYQREAAYGFIDKDGRMVIRPEFSPRLGGPHHFGIGGTTIFHEGLACVKTLDGFYGYVDREGVFVVPPTLGKATDFSDGVAWAVAIDVEKKVFTTVGFIDKSGRWVLTEYKGQKFSEHSPLKYSEGLAAVPSPDSKGIFSLSAYMDHKGVEVIKASPLSSAGIFQAGIAQVNVYDTSTGETFGYIDRRGHFIWKSMER